MYLEVVLCSLLKSLLFKALMLHCLHKQCDDCPSVGV